MVETPTDLRALQEETLRALREAEFQFRLLVVRLKALTRATEAGLREVRDLLAKIDQS